MMPPVSGLTSGTLEGSSSGAAFIGTRAAALRERVFDEIRNAGERGCTDKELQAALDMKGDTERPRRWELWREGRIQEKPTFRYTGARRKQTIWVAVPA